MHRIGGKYPDTWHLRHMLDPNSTSPGSIMPSYPWLFTQDMDSESIAARIRALQTVGVPYAEGYDEQALADLRSQAESITEDLHNAGFEEIEGIEVISDKKIIAIIAYMQRLGIDIKGENDPFDGLPSSKVLISEEN